MHIKKQPCSTLHEYVLSKIATKNYVLPKNILYIYIEICIYLYGTMHDYIQLSKTLSSYKIQYTTIYIAIHHRIEL